MGRAGEWRGFEARFAFSHEGRDSIGDKVVGRAVICAPKTRGKPDRRRAPDCAPCHDGAVRPTDCLDKSTNPQRRGLGERRKPFCAHSRQTIQNASRTILPDILEVPWKRSVNTIGTSTILRPCRQSLWVSSIWKL